MHSTTKFLYNGHSWTASAGRLIGTKLEHKERFLLVRQGPLVASCHPSSASWCCSRNKTLPLRMKQHEENGRAVAEFLSTQSKVTRLAYPGLKSHPQHELAVKQQKGFGSMLSFDLGTRDPKASPILRSRPHASLWLSAKRERLDTAQRFRH